MDEGDSLKIDALIHSFYWRLDVFKEHDYEPVASIKNNKSYLTRLHYHGIVLWQNFTRKDGKPIVYFTPGFHTPTLCNKQTIRWLEPDAYMDKMVLHGYFIPFVMWTKLHNQNKYAVESYSKKFSDKKVPEGSKFYWNKLTYYVTVTEDKKIEDLNISKSLKERLLGLSS